MKRTEHRGLAVRRHINLALSGIAVLALAACNAPGGGGGALLGWVGSPIPPNQLPNMPTDAWVTSTQAGAFDPVLAASILASPEFAAVDAFIPGFPYFGNPYTLIRLHVAHGAGFTGAGQLVSVVDDGFRITHNEFAGKAISSYGDISLKWNNDLGAWSSHGTHVAALIAGNDNANGTMFGVAPDANLHLTTFQTTLAGLRAATLDAATRGAVAQNNSWGWTSPSGDDYALSSVQNHMTVNGSTAGQALTAVIGFNSAGWNNYAAALDTFQNGGVVVWALSNDFTLNQSDAMSSLPILYPELKDAWIATGNGLFELNGAGNITDALRISAPCGQMATMCLFADGTTTSASAAGNNAYDAETGTSFAAPQVSGAVAIMAQAFPALSPTEWTRRLLASAYGDFTAFTNNITGTVNFGNGVEKSYSYEWGMGVLDIAAALSPIGTTSLVNGRSVHDGMRFEAVSSNLRASGAYGDGVINMLSGRSIALFDALNAPFIVDAGAFSIGDGNKVADSAAIPRLGATAVTGGNSFAAMGFIDHSQQIVLEDLGYTFGFSAMGGSDYVQKALGLGSENVDNVSVLSLADHTSAIFGSYDMGFANFEHYGFVGTHQHATDGSMAGVGAALSFEAMDGLNLRLGLSQTAEQGAFLGMTSSGAFAAPTDTGISAMTLSASTDLSSNLTLFGGLEYGLASGGATGGYITSVDGATFSGFQLGLRASDLALRNDRLTFTASQPLRVETGTMSLSVPVGRDQQGNILYDTVTGALAPSGRQLDLGLSYGFEPVDNGTLELGFVYSLDAGHVAGREAAAVATAFKQKF